MCVVATAEPIIRIAEPSDVEALRRLIELSARALSAGFYSRDQTEAAIRHIFGVDSQLIADHTYFIAEAGDAVVACGGWSKRKTLFGGDQLKSPVDPLLDAARDAARIRAFFVHPEFARRGIGSRMIELCEAAARGAGFARMELVATLPGEPLYAARGYRVVERFEVRLPENVNVPVARMTKPLVGRT
jgi:GNAT superfamily N-acetyltransferase